MQIRTRPLVTLAALSFALVVSTQAQAQQPEALRTPAVSQAPAPAPAPIQAPAQKPDSAPTMTAQGELVSVDAKANTFSLKTTAPAEMTFRYNEQTKVSGAQKGVAGLATATGSQVTIQYRKDGATNLATSIEVKGADAPRGGDAPRGERP
jgi:hypothetical protein